MNLLKYTFTIDCDKDEQFLKSTMVKLKSNNLDFSEFINELTAYLTLFKKYIDNMESYISQYIDEIDQHNVKETFCAIKNRDILKYTISLRNFNQHHDSEFKNYILKHGITTMYESGVISGPISIINHRVIKDYNESDTSKMVFLLGLIVAPVKYMWKGKTITCQPPNNNLFTILETSTDALFSYIRRHFKLYTQ